VRQSRPPGRSYFREEFPGIFLGFLKYLNAAQIESSTHVMVAAIREHLIYINADEARGLSDAEISSVISSWADSMAKALRGRRVERMAHQEHADKAAEALLDEFDHQASKHLAEKFRSAVKDSNLRAEQHFLDASRRTLDGPKEDADA